jgi:hypothetical protein
MTSTKNIKIFLYLKKNFRVYCLVQGCVETCILELGVARTIRRHVIRLECSSYCSLDDIHRKH